MFEKKGVRHWAEQELSLTKRKLALEPRVAEAETAAGLALLAADGEGPYQADPDSLAHAERMQAELRTLNIGLTACRRARLDAIARQRAESVAGLRRQAALKEGEAGEIESRVQGLLAEISQLEGVHYAAGILNANPASGQWGIPKSAQLRGEVVNLTTRAAALERQAIPRSGCADTEEQGDRGDPDQFILSALQIESDGPTARDFIMWRADVRRQVPDLDEHAITRERVVWRDGVIDRQQSYIAVNSLISTRQGPMMGTTVPNPSSGMFYAA